MGPSELACDVVFLGLCVSSTDLGNPCQWMLERSEWRALLLLEREDLKVIWHPGSLEAMVQCSLPYGLSRADVEAAIQAGP